MITAVLITSIICALFGGLAAYAGMYSTFRRPKLFQDFGKYVDRLKFPKKYEVDKYKELLDLSLVFIPFIYEKIKRRFIACLVYIIPSALFTGFDFSIGDIEFIPSHIEFFDLIIYMTYFVIFLIFQTQLIISKTERHFLKNYQFLSDRFYDLVVESNLTKINSIVDFSYSKRKKEYFDNENNQFKNVFDEFNNNLEFIKKLKEARKPNN